MCHPATLAFAGFALAAGREIAQARGVSQQRRAVRQAADADLEATLNDLRARLEEEQRAATLRTDAARVQTQAAVGSARTLAAGSGVAGRSVDLLVQDLLAREGDYRVSVARNLESVEGQIARQREAAVARRDSIVAGAPSYNPFLGGINVAGSIISPLLDLYSRKPIGDR